LGSIPEWVIYPFGDLTFEAQPNMNVSISLVRLPFWRANSLLYEPGIYGLYAVLGSILADRSKRLKKVAYLNMIETLLPLSATAISLLLLILMDVLEAMKE
jgi:hypothetical protein